jgi:Delta7-sterol 5-desaturase
VLTAELPQAFSAAGAGPATHRETALTLTPVLFVWVGIFVADLARYAIAAGTTAWMVRVIRWPASRRLRPKEWDRDQVRFEIGCSLVTVLIFSLTGLSIWALQQAGCTRIYTSIERFGWSYGVASLVLLIIAHDAYFYWTHRLLHRPWLLRHVHSWHHRSRQPTPWAAYSFHPGEAVLQALFLPVAVTILPLHPVTIFAFTLHMILRNAIGHSGHEMFPRAAVPRHGLAWFTTVTHHHLHHERVRGNFGLYFSWWDRLCGTEDQAYPDALAAATEDRRGRS